MASLSFSLSLSASKTLISPSPNFPSPHLNLNLNILHRLNQNSPSLKRSVSSSSSSSRLRSVVAAATAEAATETGSDVFARKLFVGKIPREMGNDELRKIIEKHGEVEKVEVMYHDAERKRGRGFAFAIMKTVGDANAVIEKLNGTEIGGSTIVVNITEKPLQRREDQYTRSPHKVFVGNLRKSVTVDKLKNFFSRKGKVLSAKVVRRANKRRPHGFVTFTSDEEVKAAISSLHNVKLGKRRVRVNNVIQ